MAKYRVPILENFEFQPAVKDKDLITPPVSPVKADRYIVGASATGDWAGKDNNIAWYDGSAWKFDVAKKGSLLWVDDENAFYYFTGTAWLNDAFGDMIKSVYDSNDNGIVDKAESVDDGAGNASTAVDVKDAVTKKHTHANKTVLDSIEEAFTTALKASYDDAVTKAHTHSNKVTLDAIEVALTNALKSNYDLAYTSRAQYDSELGMLTFEI